MKRGNLYLSISIVIYVISVVVCEYFTHDIFGGLLCAIPGLFIGCIIASAIDGYLSSRFPGFLYTPYQDKVKLVLARVKKREAEEVKILNIIENELLYPYTSLSWKYKLISDFCYDHPKLIRRLKESERYITWRDDVLRWAKYNLYRIESFYFNDGIYDYVYYTDFQSAELTDLNVKYGYAQDAGYEVLCDVEFKNERLPKDYFDFPGLVWETEDMETDNYDVQKNRRTAAEALSFGIGLGAGLELFGDNHSGCDGVDCGGADCSTGG